jgi:hypothetical protein
MQVERLDRERWCTRVELANAIGDLRGWYPDLKSTERAPHSPRSPNPPRDVSDRGIRATPLLRTSTPTCRRSGRKRTRTSDLTRVKRAL